MDLSMFCILYPMRNVHSLLLLFLLGSCTRRPLEIKYLQTKHFLLVDTSRDATEYAPIESYADFPIYYSGPLKDTIFIGWRYRRGKTPQVKKLEKDAIWRAVTARHLKIEVYTSFIINSPLEYIEPDGHINPDSTRNFYSYVFTIQNICDSIVWVGKTFSVFYLHLELKDKQGHWVKVGKQLSEMGICGTGQPHIYLRPREIIISKVKCFKGAFTTEARLVFEYRGHRIYSNIFRQSVDFDRIIKYGH